MEIALLPGREGTARLFEPFLAHAPDFVVPHPVACPPDEPLGYDRLAAHVRERIPGTCRVLLGESFSGPLAVRLAAERPGRFDALVLVATFARAPAPRVLRLLPWRLLTRIPQPLWTLRARLTGGDADLARAVRETHRLVAPDVFACRMREVLRVDVRDELRRSPVPVLALRATRDRLIGRRHSEEIVRLAARARLADVDGPHLLLQTAPRRCWEEIVRFATTGGNRTGGGDPR